MKWRPIWKKILLTMFACGVLSGYGQINVKKSLSETNHEIFTTVFSKDGTFLATTGSDNNVIVWNTETSIIYRTIEGLKKRTNTVVFSIDNQFLFTAGEDGIITMWNLTSKEIKRTFVGHKKAIKTLDIHPNGRFLASGGDDRFVRIWNIETGALVFELAGHEKDVNALQFQPNGDQLASGGADGAIIIWNISSGSILARVDKKEAHGDWVRCLAFSHDGQYIATGGDDNMIKIWCSGTLEHVKNLTGHNGWIQSISFSPNDKYLLSGSHDQYIIMWNISEGKETARSMKQDNYVLSVNFHPVLPDFVSATLYSETLNIWSYGTPGAILTNEAGVPEKETPPNIKDTKARDSIRHEITKTVVETTENSGSTTSPIITLFSPEIVSGTLEHDKPQIFLVGKTEDTAGINVFMVNKEVVPISEAGVFQYNLALVPGLNNVELLAINNDGKMNTIRFEIECTSETTPTPLGKYYALIVGINEYQDPAINSLDNAIQDAQQLFNILTSNYTFSPEDIVFLKNPTRMSMIETLDDFSRKVTPDDNLLIFYAGHGYWDEKSEVGYWLPSDASKGSSVNWFRNSTLRDFIGSIRSKHTLVIADACFSGAIFKTRAAFKGSSAGIQRLYDLPSRKAMTSGNLDEEVPDVSVFLKYLITRLEENKEPYLPSEVLFSSFVTAVLNNSQNVPRFGTIQNVGDEGGDFIFIRK